MLSKAIRISECGGPAQMTLGSIDVGEPGPGEIRVHHHAVGVNFIDVYYRTGLYPLQLPATLGMEAAGVVEAVGEGVEICFAPALKLDELRNYPHHVHRQSLLTIDGVMHQAPAPRFSRSQSAIAAAPAERGTDGREALLDWGFGEPETDLQATSWK